MTAEEYLQENNSNLNRKLKSRLLRRYVTQEMESYKDYCVNTISDEWVQNEAKEFSDNYNSPYHNSAKHGFKVGASLFKNKLLKQ